jgi:ABC-2 type transport system ATP-binding protein
MNLIETEKLTKYYGKNRGIVDVDISVAKGEIFGFIGPNGAGKSTMIKTLLNFIFPTGGGAKIFGLDCAAESHKIKEAVGYVPCEVNFYEDLRVWQLLAYSDSFHKNADSAYTRSLAEAFDIETGKKFGELSSGNKKKTALVAALASKPKLLILDEPTNGLDPLMRSTLFEALKAEQEKGTTVFLSSHNLDEVQSLCGRVAIIREGRIADVRTIKELAARSAKRVTVRGVSLPEISGEGIETVSRTQNSAVFNYRSDLKKLLQLLLKMDLKDFSVEDIKLADVFLGYYREDSDLKGRSK